MKGVKTIRNIEPPYPLEAYAHVIRPLTEEEGSGFFISFPDLPGCVSDGETIEETIQNGRGAFRLYISTLADSKKEIPKPRWKPEEDPSVMRMAASGKFVQRVPKSIHAQLVKQAREEGVSLNTLVLTYIAKGIGNREVRRKGRKTV